MQTVDSKNSDGNTSPSIEATAGGWILSSAVAKELGVATSTLKKWRQIGRGPKGWRQTSRTTVHYSRVEVERFHDEWRQRTEKVRPINS